MSAEESADSLPSGSELNGCSTEKAFEEKLSLPEDRSVSSDSFHDDSLPRRNSTGKPTPKVAKEKVIPRYLRASTGSCHDLCKYGRKDAFDEAEIRPWRKRSNKAQSSKQNVTITVVTAPLGEGKKAMELERRTLNPSKVRGQMASPDRKQSPEIAALSGEKKKEMVHKKAAIASTDRQKSPATVAPSGEKKKAVVHMQMASPDRKPRPTMAGLSGEKQKAAVHMQMASPDRKLMTTALPGEKKKGTVHKPMASSSMAVSSGEKNKATIKQMNSPVRASATVKNKPSPETMKREVPSKNVGASLSHPSLHKNLEGEKKMDKGSSKFSPQAALMKQLSSLRSWRSADKPKKAETTKTLKSSPDRLYERSKRGGSVSSDKNRAVAKSPAKKVQVHPIGSSCPSITRKKAGSSVAVDQNSVQKEKMVKSENENILEKTLHAILTESVSTLSEPAADNEGAPPLPSAEDAETEGEGEFESDEGEFDDSDSFDEDEDEHAYEEVDEIDPDQKGQANNNGVKAVDGNARKVHRKGFVMSESKDPTPVKVKFRRGRIVDLQSDNANAPRRLRFRKRRAIDEKNSHHLSESRSRTFNKKEADANASAVSLDNEKVVLRHQDAQEKKDEQGLFNNVIEETASKLVESRKSKVKALVGAFETVISLQDTKPSSQTVS